MRRIVSGLVGAGLGLAAALGLATAAHAQTTLRVSNWLPPSHPIVRDILTPWGQQVEAATKGRVKVEIMAAPSAIASTIRR